MTEVILRSGGRVKYSKTEWDFSQVQITDVAYGLAGTGRFSNQGQRWMSVAEHCTIGSLDPRLNTKNLQLLWLFHEALEGLGLSDIHGGVKHLFPDLVQWEGEGLLEFYFQVLNLLPTVDELSVVKSVDRDQLEFEKPQVYSSGSGLYYWNPDQAFTMFMGVYNGTISR